MPIAHAKHVISPETIYSKHSVPVTTQVMRPVVAPLRRAQHNYVHGRRYWHIAFLRCGTANGTRPAISGYMHVAWQRHCALHPHRMPGR